jgi:hypothetical protein
MRSIFVAFAVAAAAAPTAGHAQEATPAAVDYARPTSWLCLPGRADACGSPMAAAALNPDGYGEPEILAPAADAAADCFYIYPTISADPGLNADMNAGPEEQGMTALQFSPFASACRTFAPIYRSVTLAAIPRALAGEDVTANFDRAYGDVLAAWRHYLAHHNQGRPFVLIGHSQGAIHLTRLVAEEIEGSEAAGRMLSAMLIGFNVEVPQGALTGGSFRTTPICTAPGQTGCVVSYVSFRADAPPPASAMFGRTPRAGHTVACTNPAALGGGSAPLKSYWFTALPPRPGVPEIVWSSAGPPPTPFLRTDGLVSAQCVTDGQTGYLAVTVNADPADARTDAIPGDVWFQGRKLPDWGLHIADVNLATGDLLALVEAQSAAFARR